MTTVISAYNSSGCIGRCDAKCHVATHPDCDCICGGANHGVGLKQAIQNNQNEGDKLLGEIQDTTGATKVVKSDNYQFEMELAL